MKKLLIVGILLVPLLVFGQANSSFKKNSKIFRAGLVYQTFGVEDWNESINEVSFPIQVVWPFRPDLQIQFMSTAANSGYGDYTLSGLSDTYVKTTYLFADKKGLAGVGLGLPTGITELDYKQFLVAQLISINVLRFQLPVFGQGLTGNLGVAYAQPMSDKVVLGGGFCYIYRGQYNPVQNTVSDYDPGDQVSVNVGADFLLNEQMKLFVDGIYNLYLADKIKGREAFGSGDKICFNVGFLMNSDLITILANAVFRQKGKNEMWDGSKLVDETKNSNGPQVEFDGMARYGINERTGALGYVILRAYGENEYKTADAAVFGLGGGVDRAVSPQFTIDAAIKGYFGRLGGGKAAKSLNGFEFQVGCSLMR